MGTALLQPRTRFQLVPAVVRPLDPCSARHRRRSLVLRNRNILRSNRFRGTTGRPPNGSAEPPAAIQTVPRNRSLDGSAASHWAGSTDPPHWRWFCMTNLVAPGKGPGEPTGKPASEPGPAKKRFRGTVRELGATLEPSASVAAYSAGRLSVPKLFGLGRAEGATAGKGAILELGRAGRE